MRRSPLLSHLCPTMPSIDHKKLPSEGVTVKDPAPSVDPQKVLRKMDLYLLLPVCILYLMCVM